MSTPDDAVRAMAWRAVQEYSGLTWANDSDLILALMQCAFSHDFGFDQLEAFRGAHRIGCFGFFRDRTHYAGVARVDVGYSIRTGIMVQTDGDLEGVWVFMLDADSSVLTSRSGQGVESFQGLEGLELIEAVVSSALTSELSRPSGRRGFFRR